MRNREDQLHYLSTLMEPARRYPPPPPAIGLALALLALVGSVLTLLVLDPAWRTVLPAGLERHPGRVALAVWSPIILAGLIFALLLLGRQMGRMESSLSRRVRREVVRLMLPFGLITVFVLYAIGTRELWSLIPPSLLAIYGLFVYVAGHFTVRPIRWMGGLCLIGGLAVLTMLLNGFQASSFDELSRSRWPIGISGGLHVLVHLGYALSVWQYRRLKRRGES